MPPLVIAWFQPTGRVSRCGPGWTSGRSIPSRPVLASRRVVPIIKALVLKAGVPVSVDTYKPEVAEASLDAGASIVNVIKGTPISTRLLRVIGRYGAADSCHEYTPQSSICGNGFINIVVKRGNK